MSRYAWLKDELARIPRKKFHILKPQPLTALAEVEATYGPLPADYREFVPEFGEARLFRSDLGDLHHLGVLVPPRIILPEKDAEPKQRGVVLLELGYYINTHSAWLQWKDGQLLQEGAVFVGYSWQLRKGAASFEEWLQRSFRAAGKLLNKRAWAEVLKPAPPFTEREQRIVEAMPQFLFRKVGVAQSGKVLVEIENRSALTLLYFTVGVRAINGMEGAVALPVSEIAPGMVKVLEADFYLGSMDPNTLELYRQTVPGIEDRQYFAEFRESLFPEPGQ